jgi:hypothetical protein
MGKGRSAYLSVAVAGQHGRSRARYPAPRSERVGMRGSKWSDVEDGEESRTSRQSGRTGRASRRLCGPWSSVHETLPTARSARPRPHAACAPCRRALLASARPVAVHAAAACALLRAVTRIARPNLALLGHRDRSQSKQRPAGRGLANGERGQPALGQSEARLMETCCLLALSASSAPSALSALSALSLSLPLASLQRVCAIPNAPRPKSRSQHATTHRCSRVASIAFSPSGPDSLPPAVPASIRRDMVFDDCHATVSTFGRRVRLQPASI